ncbi:IclR family transcriptional regulator [Domibacillus antri]|uniref:Glycerol operon regulatory protein n=1 Tax=Domibacillus antri TaxID=1714264 RepID=A0A1Q8Q3D5_9BACI|nr:IclR family transcriptional regulator [Domibacillus antri]OLN21791.1 IclR family transcriptional regulator [Domibacillus antri]
MSEEQLLSSVKNALRILRSFSMEEPEKKVNELAESLGMNKSTVSRMMTTLASEGFVYKDQKTKKYRLGISALALSGIASSQLDISRESQSVLKELVETIEETVHLSVLDQLEVMYLEKVECQQPVRVLTYVGGRNPAYCTSAGKVILAFSEKSLTEKVIADGLKSYTEYTITDPADLYEHLEQIRESGYAYSIEELQEGVTSVAAPVFDHTGSIVAALSVVGPKQRIQPHKIPVFAKRISIAAVEISARLGYRCTVDHEETMNNMF